MFGAQDQISAERRVERAVAQVDLDELLEISEAIRVLEAVERVAGAVEDVFVDVEKVQVLEVPGAAREHSIAEEGPVDTHLGPRTVVLVSGGDAEVVAGEDVHRGVAAEDVRLRELHVVLGGDAALLDVHDRGQDDVRGVDPHAQLAQAAQEVVDGELGAPAHLLTLQLGAHAAAEAQLVELAGAHVDLHVSRRCGLRGQVEPHRREDAEIVEAALRGSDLTGIEERAGLPGHAIHDFPGWNRAVAEDLCLAEADERPGRRVELDDGAVLVAIDVDTTADLGVGVAKRTQAIGEPPLERRIVAVFEDLTRNDVVASRLLPRGGLDVRREAREANLVDAGGGVLLNLDDDVDATFAVRLNVMSRDPRVEETSVGVEGGDALEVDIEGRLVEPLLGCEGPPARLLGREDVLEIARRDLTRTFDVQVMDPGPRRQIVVSARNQVHGNHRESQGGCGGPGQRGATTG